MLPRRRSLGVLALAILASSLPAAAQAATTAMVLNFSNTPLVTLTGDSEPMISIGANGTMAVAALSWLPPSISGVGFASNLWTGPFGSTPVFQGSMDATLRQAGFQIGGGGDVDVDLGTTGALHARSEERRV